MDSKAANRVVVLSLVALTLFHLALFWGQYVSSSARNSDFTSFYAAAMLVREGSAGDLYTYEAQEKIHRELFPGSGPDADPVLFYYHPPFELLVFLPLTFLSFRMAYLIWVVANLFLLVSLPFLLRPSLGALWRHHPPVVFLAGLAFFPVLVTLLQGQDSLLLLLVIAMAYVALSRGKEGTAGGLLALGLFKFHLIVPLVLVFLLRRRWKLLLGFLGVAAGLVLLSISITGWEGSMKYPYFILKLNQGLDSESLQQARNIYPGTMPNLRGTLHALLADRIPAIVTTLATFGLSFVLLLWAASKWTRAQDRPENSIGLAFSLSVVTALLTGFHLHVHDMSLLLVPILLTVEHWLTASTGPRPARSGLVKLIMIFFVSPFYLALLYFEQLHLLAWLMLAFAFALSLEIERSRRSAQPA